MSFTDLDVIARYTAGSGQTDFALTQAYFNTSGSEIKVYTVDESADPATVTEIDNGAAADEFELVGGDLTLVPPTLHTTVRFGTAPADDIKVVIIRDSVLEQEDTLATGTTMAQVEVSLNKLQAQIQELDSKIKQSLKFRRTSEESDQPVPDAVANKLMAWNSGGTALELISKNEGLISGTFRAGREVLADQDVTEAVSFSSDFDDTNYTVIACLQNTTDSFPDFQPITITAKSASGFTASWNAPVDGSNYSLAWFAMEDA